LERKRSVIRVSAPQTDDGLSQVIQAIAIHSADRGGLAQRFGSEDPHSGQRMLAPAWQG